MHGVFLIVQVAITVITPRVTLHIFLKETFWGLVSLLHIYLGITLSYLMDIYLGGIPTVLKYDRSDMTRGTKLLKAFVESFSNWSLPTLMVSFRWMIQYRLYSLLMKLELYLTLHKGFQKYPSSVVLIGWNGSAR